MELEFKPEYLYAAPTKEAVELIGSKVIALDHLSTWYHTDTGCFTLMSDVTKIGNLSKVGFEYPKSRDYPFKVDGESYRYIYYDPYLEFKLAFEKGVTVEHYDKYEDDWFAIQRPEFTDSPSNYRIGGEPKDFSLGDKVTVASVGVTGIITAIDSRPMHKLYCIGNEWYAAEELVE